MANDENKALMRFFNAMDEVFFSFDVVNSKLLYVTNGCEKLTGFKPGYFLADYKLWLGLIHPDDKDIAVNERSLLLQGKQINSRFRIIRKDGQVRWIEQKIIPGLDDNAQLIRIDGIAHDITEHKEAEDKHLMREERYRQIVENAQEGIWTIDAYDKTNFVNQKICDMLGYTPQEMIGKELYDFMDDEGKAYAIACMQRRRAGAKENLDIRYVTKSGNDVWANISANPMFNDKGQYIGALAMITDITKRREDEEAIKKSEANLRTIFDNTDTAYVLFNHDLKVVSFNSLAQKFSEEQNEKCLEINRHIKYYFTEDRWPFIEDLLKRVKTEGSVDYELSYNKKTDGQVRWHNVRWLNVQTNDNKHWGYILANKEITEAKLAALERERITADLIQHNKDLEQFTYIVSHNLRAPVANIMGLAGILKAAKDDTELMPEVLDKLFTSIKNMDAVIKDLNHILQARKPGNEEKEMVYFNALVDDIRISIADAIAQENVHFDCSFQEAETIYTIRSYMYSIIYNLVSNSIKYRKTGIPAIISIKTYLSKDGKLTLKFKDNGKGIDIKKNSSNLFGLYKRFDLSVEGKGMGLFMVKTQVEALGGTIHIDSSPGEGVEFTMRFSS